MDSPKYPSIYKRALSPDTMTIAPPPSAAVKKMILRLSSEITLVKFCLFDISPSKLSCKELL